MPVINSTPSRTLSSCDAAPLPVATFTTSTNGCFIRLTNTSTITGVTNIEYVFKLGGTTLETVNTTSTNYDWDKSSLFAGENITIEQTVTGTTSGSSSQTITFPAFTSCYWQFNSNNGTGDTFDPSIAFTGSPTAYWRTPDNAIRSGTSLSGAGSTFGFDGTTKTVRFYTPDFTLATGTTSLDDDKIVGTVNFSGFTQTTRIDILNNPSHTGLTLPASSVLTTLLGTQSGLTSIDFTQLPTGHMIATVDLSLNSLTTATFPTSSVNISTLNLRNNNLTTLNLSGLTGLGGTVNLSNNSGLATLTLPSSSRPFAQFAANNCGLTTLNLSPLTGLSGQVLFSGNNSLTSVTNPSSSGSVTLYRCFDCNLSTLDLSPLTNMSGQIQGNDNSSMTSVTFPASTGTMTLIRFHSCDLGYINMTTITFASTADVELFDNNMTAAEVNHILVDLDATMPGSGTGTISMGGTNAAPDGSSGGYDGVTAKNNLISKGYTVTTS